jgi:ABC-type transport system substrate-binding protein
MLIAMVAVACGGDDEAAAVPAATSAPQAAATSAPQAAATSVPKAAAKAAATSVPQAAATSVPEPADTTSRGQPKVETLVLGVDPGAGETNTPWAGVVDHHQQFDLVMEVLVDIEPETSLFVPELAKSWELSEDGTEWRFQLEDGVPWHNNWGEFTGEDIFHTVAMWQRDDSLLAFSNDWREIDLDHSTIHSPYDITLKLKNPNPDYLFIVSPGGGGLVMSKAQWDAEGDEGYEKDMIGTGPYRYAGRTYGVDINYELLPDHWRRNNPAPDFQKMQFQWIAEPATRAAGLLAGDIHLTEITKDQARSAVNDSGMKLISSNFPGNGAFVVFQGLFPTEENNFDPPWDQPDLPVTDVRVREAMNRAVNKNTINRNLFDGRAHVGFTAGFWKQMSGWSEDWVTNWERDYGYDPERAKELLIEAGYPNGFEITGFAMNFPGWPEYNDVMEAIGLDFEKVGIKLTLETYLFPNYLAGIASKNRDTTGLWIIPNSPIDVQAILTILNWTPGALHSYETEEFDRVLNLLKKNGNVDERQELMVNLGNQLYYEYAYLNLFHTFIEWTANPNIIDQWSFPGSDGANYGHFDLITACVTEEPCFD